MLRYVQATDSDKLSVGIDEIFLEANLRAQALAKPGLHGKPFHPRFQTSIGKFYSNPTKPSTKALHRRVASLIP